MLAQDDDARGALASLRVLLIGGEAFPGALAAQLKALGVPRIVNMYGPTETTIWSSTHPVDGSGEAIPIGRPIANTELYVLDAQRRPVPVGVAAELYIGGAGVTRGYLNRPELSAERFVPDPFRNEPGARLYRTGDLARWRDDGVMEFLGRIDHQVKIRGHRIELGEIESALTDHAGVREAVVFAREDAPGDVRLVGYVIARDSHRDAWQESDALAAALREWLRDRLPDAMVPSNFVALDAFPQTPNKKIDRKALPAPNAARVAASAAEPATSQPASELEKAIAQVWREVLHVDRVGSDDNFFDLGGHSLLAVKTHRRLVEVLPRRVSITDLFRFPTVRTLAEYVGGASGPSLQQSQDRAALRQQALSKRRSARAGRREPGETDA
jgi:acyl-coenzyme A synthetase/AMP-(fatty) acid ligase